MIDGLKENHNVSLICKVLGVPRSIEHANLKQEIKTIYGAPKIHKILSKKFDISIKKVQRFMKELGLRSILIKKFKNYTTKVDIVEKDNVLDRDCSTTTINEKWVGDSFGKSMTTDLIIRALDNTYTAQRPDKDLYSTLT